MRSPHVIKARTVRHLNLLHQSVPLDLLRYEHLHNLDPSEVCYERTQPCLLIGSDNWELIVSKQFLIGGHHEPAASRTELGWVIHGSAPGTTTRNKTEQVLHIRTWIEPTRNEPVNELIRFYELDAHDTLFNSKIEVPRNEEPAPTKWESRLLRYSKTRGALSTDRLFYEDSVQKYTSRTSSKISTRAREKTNNKRLSHEHLTIHQCHNMKHCRSTRLRLMILECPVAQEENCAHELRVHHTVKVTQHLVAHVILDPANWRQNWSGNTGPKRGELTSIRLPASRPAYLPAPVARTPCATLPGKPVLNTPPAGPGLTTGDTWNGRHNSRNEPRNEDCRARSPTPNRSRNRSIEALVECFERMSQYRPPPRSSTELPTFSGCENEWLPFKASMRDSTQLFKFSSIENLQRLRNALKGEARDAVASLLYTACDPTEIMEALEQSFGRPEALIDKALEEIKMLPPLGPTTTELNIFAVKVRNIVATITNVEGLEGCLQNRMLTRDIVEKLPTDLRRSFARYASENRQPREPHIVTLSRFLNHEASIGLEFTYSKPQVATTSNQQEHARSTRTTSQTTVYTANCCCCGGNHEPQCKKLQALTVNERWNWAKANKVCFKCLTEKHQRTETMRH